MRLLWCVLCLCACDVPFNLPAFQHVADGAYEDAPVPRPDLPLDTCGMIGARCCNDTSCSDGSTCLALSGRSRCVGFAGTFESNPAPSCGFSPCLESNPLAAACACPSGLVPSSVMLDIGCGDPLLAANQTGTAAVCAIATQPPGSDFAGLFVVADIAACEPTTTGGCMLPDPITGTCTCPAGVEQFSARVFVPGTIGPGCTNGFLGATLGVCLPTGVAQASLLGVYQLDADQHCRAFSNSLAGCTCPAGSLVSSLRTLVDKQPSGSFIPVESTIAFCLAAP